MTERIIVLRPHHIDRFVSYYHNFANMFDNPAALQKIYGKEFVAQLKDLYEMIASGGTCEEYIRVKSGIDTICFMCPIKQETCSDSDSLSIWNGSGQVMQEMKLIDGMLYPIGEFLERVKKARPYRSPKNAIGDVY
jgi:hypothetical protein